tara:strand:+ start:793 stop:1428 length:636 start_codon:yes stop_codon:yes gene_type:complete
MHVLQNMAKYLTIFMPMSSGTKKSSGAKEKKIDAGILGALIRMDQHPVLWLSPPDGHQQCLQNNLCILSLLQCPANHHAGIKVNDDGKIRKSFLCLDIGDVSHPSGIWSGGIKLPIQFVGSDDSRFAAIFAGTLLVTDPGADACITGQSGDTVRTATFSHIQQIIMDFAVAICPTAVFPYLAKYAVAFFRISRSSVIRASSCFRRRISDDC